MTETAVRAGAAVALSGLRKRFGEVRAVDGIDLVISPGEVVALLGPNGAGKSTTVDLLLGLSTPDGGQKQRVRFALALVCEPDLLVLDEPTVAMDVETRRAFWQQMRAYTDTGRTVLFATHYLEEAEEYADRVVLMRAGKIMADGSVAQVRAAVSGRTLRAVVPGAADLSLPGVRSAERRGDQITLTCTDSDAAVRALLSRYPTAHDIEITALLVCAIGAVEGVRMDAAHWLGVLATLWLGAIPFVLLGIVIGLVASADVLGEAAGAGAVRLRGGRQAGVAGDRSVGGWHSPRSASSSSSGWACRPRGCWSTSCPRSPWRCRRGGRS